MADEDRAKRTAPRHSGREEDQEAWNAKTRAWAAGEDLEDVLYGDLDPRLYPRRTTAVNIATDDDPRGPRGTRLSAQSQTAYDTSISNFKVKNKKGWAAILPQLDGNALSIAMRAAHGDGRAVIRLLNEGLGAKSRTQTAQMLIEFIKAKKDREVTVADHANSWLDAQRRIDENDGFDKDTMQTVLYLMSLGPQYRMFVNLACMYSREQFNLRNVMAKAKEFQLHEPADEADSSAVALAAAEQARRGTTDQNWTRTPCSNCGHPFHTAAECFAKGGGLSHLSADERGEWLEAKRKRRAAQRERREQANSAQILQRKIRKAKEKLRNEGLVIDLGL